ncbi:hypothetical protein [Caldicellulosiruptor owensensis]|nr:hypothetical protein [Caldicellulosiruptor owensensis]
MEEGTRMSWEDVVNEAVRIALENADWTELKPFRYKASKYDEGYFWKLVYVKLEYGTWKKAREYTKNGIELDDVINFALLFVKKFMTARMKKDILDKKWTIKRAAMVIEKIAGGECISVESDRVEFEVCPICKSDGFMVFFNDNDILPFGYCLKCRFHNIWEILCETGTGSFIDVVHKAWEILEEKDSKEQATTVAKQEYKQKTIQQKPKHKRITELEEERRRIIEENFEGPYKPPEEEYREAQEIIRYLSKISAEKERKPPTKHSFKSNSMEPTLKK